MTSLFAASLVLRSVGAAIRSLGETRRFRVAGWMVCGVAAWMAAGYAGAWSELWIPVVLAILLSLVDSQSMSAPVRFGGDCIILITAGVLSVPPPSLHWAAPVIVVFSCAGFLMDRALQRGSGRVRIAYLALASGLCVLVVAAKLDSPAERATQMWRFLPHMGIAPARNGQRIELATGAVAWLETPAGVGPHPAAVLFHGNDAAGSKQAAACILRRALVHAGFEVLAVDHPAFGDSPLPGPTDDLESWNPLPTAVAAVNTLAALPHRRPVLAVGHSMGTSDVLRLLGTPAASKIDQAILFGASFEDIQARFGHWYAKFHRNRRMRLRISRQLFSRIKQRYVVNAADLRALPTEHPPVLFVRLGDETRSLHHRGDAVYEAIPGRKSLWDLPFSTHYFSAYTLSGIVMGNVRITRTLTRRFRELGRASGQ